MSKQVNGYLANDGSFFEHEPECQRYEAERDLAILCETHGVNFENFFAMLNAWHNPIGRYYDADDKCQTHQVGAKPKLDVDQYEPLPPTEEDRTNNPSGDKDSPGFLEQSLRRYQ
jgi:hypothetical protein